jgi:hypothetical protein
MEGLGLLELTVGDREAAITSFEQARQYYGKTEDAMRATLHEAFQLRSAHREPEALALLAKMIGIMPSAPSADLLRSIESQIRSSVAKAK